MQCSNACPLYPRKRTFVRTGGISANEASSPSTSRRKRVVDGLSSRFKRGQNAQLCYPHDMLKRETFPVANIYEPTARRKTLDLKRVDSIAHSMLTEGQQTPILVRADGARFVLVEGLHRLEAAKALGEATIVGYRVNARRH